MPQGRARLGRGGGCHDPATGHRRDASDNANHKGPACRLGEPAAEPVRETARPLERGMFKSVDFTQTSWRRRPRAKRGMSPSS